MFNFVYVAFAYLFLRKSNQSFSKKFKSSYMHVYKFIHTCTCGYYWEFM